MLKIFNFECLSCDHTFEELVEGVEGKPEACPECSASKEFKKLPAMCSSPTKIIVDYPGSKKFKAGYQHTHNLDAEKKGRQVTVPRTTK